VSGIPARVHYRKADIPGEECGTCSFYNNGLCEMFDRTPVNAGYVCDKWDDTIDKSDPAIAPMYTAPIPSSPPETPEGMMDLLGALEPEPRVGKAGGALYLISHAKTRYNRPGQPHDIVHGWKDTPLDSTGRQQARKLGKFLGGLGIEQLHSSDLKRAAQTAQVIGSVSGVPVKAGRQYRPWNLGDFAGHSSSDVIPKLRPYMEDKSGQPVDGGESFDNFTDRFLPALEKLLTQVKSGKTIGLVTHSRNMELTQGWLGGRRPRKEIDTKAISIDKIDPGVVLKITPQTSSRWQIKQIDDATVSKGQAYPTTLNLRVNGVHSHPSGQRVYRMVTREGHYIGKTNPTPLRALKGEVLKIQANDFGMNPYGDFTWVNPNVESHYGDSPHSWRELEAMAGGLVKEFASGPGGDAPPAGDSPTGTSEMMSAGTLAAMTPAATTEVYSGTGPTLTSVHRRRPLRHISTAYGAVEIKKADRHKQLIYGVVLEPNTMDSQDDYMLPDQVEKAAHGYLKKVARGKASVSKLQHLTQGFFKNKQGLVPVESYIAPVDFTYDGVEMIKKGTWVLCIHCEDPGVWQDVLDGKYTGFSIGGTGIRQSMSVPPEVTNGYMESQPSGWFSSNGGVAKTATPEDFALWRTCTWEGSS
jgi:broad specificity phosphatase PhoE